jgi:hypothetical protein
MGIVTLCPSMTGFHRCAPQLLLLHRDKSLAPILFVPCMPYYAATQSCHSDNFHTFTTEAVTTGRPAKVPEPVAGWLRQVTLHPCWLALHIAGTFLVVLFLP